MMACGRLLLMRWTILSFALVVPSPNDESVRTNTRNFARGYVMDILES